MIRAGRSGAILCMMVVAASGMLGGCNVAGYVTQGLIPPSDIPALYTPADRLTLVLVDDPAQKMPTIAQADQVAGRVGHILVAQKVIGRFVPTTAVTELRDSEADFSRWAIDRVGRRVGAEQVIYILLQDLQLTESGHIYRPVASVRVKVLDVASGSRMFPADNKHGHALTTVQEYEDLEARGRGTEAVVARRLAEQLAEDIAKIFYKHEPKPVGHSLPG